MQMFSIQIFLPNSAEGLHFSAFHYVHTVEDTLTQAVSVQSTDKPFSSLYVMYMDVYNQLIYQLALCSYVL